MRKKYFLPAVLLAAALFAAPAAIAADYVGSNTCRACHPKIYERWRKTPMANIVRDPHESPGVVIPDLSKPNPMVKFTVNDIALVYGSLWKQRYFTKIGDDYYVEPAQWDVAHQVWRPYMVANGTDWWAPLYPPDNVKRPTSALCDGCHSVNFDIHTKKVTEWNVGCERCHGPGSDHAAHPARANIINPARLEPIAANDICIQCHSQGRPLTNPIEGKYYDWPVGYEPGKKLQDFWGLEEHKLGETTFTHYADGTAHKNRMQGNDFVQSVMYTRGVKCSACHDVHGTENYAQLLKPASDMCLECHGPGSPNGPHTGTIQEHTHHAPNSAGSDCVGCHMPAIQAEISDVMVHSHTFKFIGPSQTKQYKIPNACNTCHKDKSTDWAEAALRSWTNVSPWR
ncbi:MAG TPA: cytochrome c3 family protein [Bryobacteraceae bacterium]|nr:cytochrome c3 family protein [Bryobacteraceae bacterium]